MPNPIQTVSVPVDLLKYLANGATLTQDYLEGTRGELSGTAALALKSILEYLPSPPKVGDTLSAEQVADLPNNAIVVDEDGEAWVSRGEGKVLYFRDAADVGNEQAPSAGFAPYTLVYLPRD